MDRTEKILLVIGSIAAVALLIPAGSYKTYLTALFKRWEKFISYPKWDYKQWSWGYGTEVPNSIPNEYIRPSGSITEPQAMIDAMSHVMKDRSYLSTLITVPLNAKQWAALLSFSYNLGAGNADNLVKNINNQDWQALEYQWNQYVNAGGEIKQNLIDRRRAEWELFRG